MNDLFREDQDDRKLQWPPLQNQKPKPNSFLSKPQFCFGEPLILHCTQTGSVKKLQTKGSPLWISLVVQWIRIHLTLQGTWVQSLVWENSTCLVYVYMCACAHTLTHVKLFSPPSLPPSLPLQWSTGCLLAYCSAIFNLCYCTFFLYFTYSLISLWSIKMLDISIFSYLLRLVL